MLRLLFILAALMMLGMVFGPMRRHILRRLDITATILLIVLPLMAAGRLLYTVRQGGWEERDNIAFVVLIVTALIGLWIGLWWLTNTLERRRPTPGGGLPLFPGGLAQRWLGLPAVPAVPAAEVERKGLGLARFTGRLWGRTRGRRGSRQGQRTPANSPATPAAAKPAATPAAAPASRRPRTTAKPRQSATARRSTTRRRSPRRRAASSSKMDDAAMTLGRIGGHLFGKAEKATRPKTSSSRRRRK
ncbi:MAG: hypothetical protein OXU67_14000 [Chloroflexota bacterium]|nr:hypothetical protein [Chloroflexota bacterium]